jgi:hypothetical protein
MRRMEGFVAFAMASMLCMPASGCGSKSSLGPTVAAKEVWTVDIGSGQGGGELTFIKSSNGDVTAVGEWLLGDTDCPFSTGPGAVSDSTISFIATGIATQNAMSSSFTLTVEGTARGGGASGTYSIVFSQGWTTSAPPVWTAWRTSGSGITP